MSYRSGDMERQDADPEDDSARLSQEATNQSTPEKSLTDEKRQAAAKLKVPKNRSKPPEE